MIAGIDFAEGGAGPVVVCLHGIGGGGESFRPQIDGLVGFRVVSWNMPGYGGSDPGDWPPTFAGLSARLASFIDGLGAGPVHLVGQSIGGMIALDHGLRRPEQVRTLTLIGTTPAFGGRDDSFRDAFLKARLEPLERGLTMPELAAESAPRLAGPQADPRAIAEIAGILAKVPEATWRGILECLVTFNRRDDLGAVIQPCCLIVGSDDRNAPAKTMAKMAERLPRAEYHEIPGAGHMINQEAPESTNQIISDFLRRHP